MDEPTIDIKEVRAEYRATILEMAGTELSDRLIDEFMQDPRLFVPTERELTFLMSKWPGRNDTRKLANAEAYLRKMFTKKGRRAIEARIIGKRRLVMEVKLARRLREMRGE